MSGKLSFHVFMKNNYQSSANQRFQNYLTLLIEHAPSNNSAKPQPAANQDAVRFVLKNSNRSIIEERQCPPAIAYSRLPRSDSRTYPFASTFRGRQGEVNHPIIFITHK